MADQDRKKTRGKQPISRHPLFAVTVALWFGALFGLGSLAIRPALLESLVQALNIDAIVPAAAPPLGITARILLALVMAGVGGLLGAAAARRIARPDAQAGENDRFAAPATAPQRSDDAGDGNALWSELKIRRRALAAEQSRPRPEQVQATPPPVRQPQILNLANIDLEGFGEDRRPGEELPQAAIDDREAALPDVLDLAETAISPQDEGGPDDSEAPEIRRFDMQPAAPSVEPDASSTPAPSTSTAAERLASADLDELSHIELLERLALSLQRRSERSRVKPAPLDPRVERIAAQPALANEVADEDRFEPATHLEPEEAAEPDIGAVPPYVAVPAALRPVGPAEEDDEQPLPSIVPPRYLAMPAEAEPEPEVMQVDETPAESSPTESSPTEPSVVEAAGMQFANDPGRVEELDEESRSPEDGYSSLLDLGRLPPPRQQQFVRIDEPESDDDGAIEPAVIFPGQTERQHARFAAPSPAPATSEAPPPTLLGRRPFDAPGAAADESEAPSPTKPQDPEETERALRAALAALQRMSGTA